MRIKKIVFIGLLISASLFAQRPNHGRIKAIKTAYITEQLDLSAVEAEKFWPIYNDYENKVEALRKEERQEIFNTINGGGIETLTDSQANELIDRVLEIKTLELQYNKELVGNLRKVLSPKKVIKLKRTEERFKKRLLEMLKKRRGKRD